MEKIKRTYYLEKDTERKITQLAELTRRSKGAIIDIAVELYASSRDNGHKPDDESED